MKSLKSYSLPITEEQYHALPCWSHSAISTYADKGFSCIATLHDKKEPTASMRFGSLFDSMLTKGKATLDEYVVSDTVCPPAEKEVLDKLAETYRVSFDKIPVEHVIDVMNTCEYQPRWKDQTRYEKVSAQSSYYNIIISGKKVVSTEEWNDAAEMYKVFRNNEYLNNLFGTKNTAEKEYLYQTKFQVTLKLHDDREVVIRFMPDLMVVDHKKKTIQITDLKTSAAPAYDFAENFLRYRYDIQAAMYTDGLEEVIKSIPEYKDYTILPFLFTDISRSDKVPVTYEYDPRDMSQSEGLFFETNNKSYQYKDWRTLLSEIIDYEESNAVVPKGIITDGPNKMIDVLSKRGR